LGLACAGNPSAAEAQGFQLKNLDRAAGVDAPVFAWTGSLLWGPEWCVELYGGPTPDDLAPALIVGPEPAREIIPLWRPGYFRSTVGVTPPGVNVGDWAWLQVRVWSVTLGATYEAAVAEGLGGYGESAVFLALGSPPEAQVPPAPLLGLRPFTVREIIPEPSTWALGLLAVGGGCAWRLLRRRWLSQSVADSRSGAAGGLVPDERAWPERFD
jgi:MYXO-CTERM domain-containing protein